MRIMRFRLFNGRRRRGVLRARTRRSSTAPRGSATSSSTMSRLRGWAFTAPLSSSTISTGSYGPGLGDPSTCSTWFSAARTTNLALGTAAHRAALAQSGAARRAGRDARPTQAAAGSISASAAAIATTSFAAFASIRRRGGLAAGRMPRRDQVVWTSRRAISRIMTTYWAFDDVVVDSPGLAQRPHPA